MSRLVVVPHDTCWAEQFRAEAMSIQAALGETLAAIHHSGSTSIPGIYAKPVIDILLEVTVLRDQDSSYSALAALGYEAKGEFGIPGRRYFRKDDENGIRTHQGHSFEVGSDELARHLAFRDHMRSNRNDAVAYSDLKRRLAEMYPDDPEAYMDGKDGFIKAIDCFISQSEHPRG